MGTSIMSTMGTRSMSTMGTRSTGITTTMKKVV